MKPRLDHKYGTPSPSGRLLLIKVLPIPTNILFKLIPRRKTYLAHFDNFNTSIYDEVSRLKNPVTNKAPSCLFQIHSVRVGGNVRKIQLGFISIMKDKNRESPNKGQVKGNKINGL